MSTLKDTLAVYEYEGVTVANGFDDAAVGVVERCGQPPIVVYDYAKCAEILHKRDGMTMEDACEYLDFNCVGAWVGPETPGWLVIRLHKGKVDLG